MLRNGFNFYFICLKAIGILAMFLGRCDTNFSNNATNKEWCYFKSLSSIEAMSFCKFKCWSANNTHLNVNNDDLRRSIVSLNVQITEKGCDNEIGSGHLAKLENLSTFLITGHIKMFNLTFLMSEAPNLKKLSISSLELKHLLMDNLNATRLVSLYLVGVFEPKQWQFVKASIKTLASFYLTLNKKIIIPERLFFQMPQLQYINLQIVAEKMCSNSFADLPKLIFVSLHNNYFHYPIRFQRHVFANLPSLRTMKIFNFEIENSNADDDFCVGLSGNIESFILETSSILFIERCMEAWRCVECGLENSDVSQTMEFRSLLTNFKAQTTKLDDILPNPATMYFLNTTKLQLIDTHIPIITQTSLARFPLMTHYHHHRSWRLHERIKPFNSFGDIDKFTDNPFEMLLTNKSKLIEVKISISICDCISFQVYRFLVSHNVSVYFYCRNLASEFEFVNTDSWVNKTFFEHFMVVKCPARMLDVSVAFVAIAYVCLQLIMFSY